MLLLITGNWKASYGLIFMQKLVICFKKWDVGRQCTQVMTLTLFLFLRKGQWLKTFYWDNKTGRTKHSCLLQHYVESRREMTYFPLCICLATTSCHCAFPPDIRPFCICLMDKVERSFKCCWRGGYINTYATSVIPS